MQRRNLSELPCETKGLQSLRWLSDPDLLALVYDSRVDIISVDRVGPRFRIANGSKPLGSITTVKQLSSRQVLVAWEFGRARIYDLAAGRHIDLGDFKTACDGASHAIRPNRPDGVPLFAYLRKDGAEDALCIRTDTGAVVKQTKLQTTDAQSVSWSSNGNWLAVLDAPISSTGVGLYVYTADGNRFVTYPRSPHQWPNELGIKEFAWSPGAGGCLALASHSGDVVMLNTKTFLPNATLEHTPNVVQDATSDGEMPVWNEVVSASGERAYEMGHWPASPVLTRAKAPTDPKELGISEMCFNASGTMLATRDERFQSTLWIWSTGTSYGRDCAVQSLILQHRNIRKVSWHPNDPSIVMFDCGEANMYLYNTHLPDTPPMVMNVPIPGNVGLHWVSTGGDSDEVVILATTKSRWCVLYPERDPNDEVQDVDHKQQTVTIGEESHLEDSLFEVLSCRKPTTKAATSYTERIDMEAESDMTGRLDDTFREKRKPAATSAEVDPFEDDSQIF